MKGVSNQLYLKKHNDKAYVISVVNSYSDDQFMYNFLETFHKSVKQSAYIASHQIEFSR